MQHLWRIVSFSYHLTLCCCCRLGSRVYSLLFIGTALASFIGLLVANLILPLFGWAVVYMLFAVICLFSLLLLLMFEEKPTITERNKANDEDDANYYNLMVETKRNGGV